MYGEFTDINPVGGY